MKAYKSARNLCLTALALGSVLAAAAMPAHAQGGVPPGYPDGVQGYDPREVALLPRYCIHTQLFRNAVPGGYDQEEIKRWYSVMGPSFNNMHHYCWGLMKTNRALLLARTPHFRRFYLNDSLQEFDYVIRSSPPDFGLLPEILTKKGENLIRLDRGPQGILELERAIELKPDYWPSYAALSDYYKTTGDLAKAREWLEKGLSVTPDVKALKRRLVEVDEAKDKPKTAPQRPGKPSAPD
jgi:tetratricopeptide (TPR) repeat protein